MAKKDKKIKLENNSLEIISYFKEYLENSVLESNYARFVSFEEHHDKDDYALFAILDYDKFKAKIIYRPSYFFANNFIDVKFIFDTDYEYSIYDIFNLYDIKDFTQYYYSNIISKSDVENALFNILKMIDKYTYDIEKTAQSENLCKLKSNFESDWNAVSGNSDNWKDDIYDPYVWDFVHPFFTCASDAVNSEKLLKKLRKQNNKGKLDTLYEKRLLEYMEQGNEFVNKNEVERQNFEKGFNKSTLLINTILIVIAAIFSALLIFAVKSIVFEGAYVPVEHIQIGSLKFPLPITMCAGWVCSTMFFGGFLINLLGAKLLSRLTGNDERIAQRYTHEQNENYGTKKKVPKIIINIVCVILAVLGIIFSAVINIGFYDDKVKFTDDYSLTLCTVSYDDLIIYKLQGYYDDDTDEYVEYDNAYAVADSKGHIYNLEEVDTNGNTQKRIDDIIKKYNKEIVEVKSIEDIE